MHNKILLFQNSYSMYIQHIEEDVEKLFHMKFLSSQLQPFIIEINKQFREMTNIRLTLHQIIILQKPDKLLRI